MRSWSFGTPVAVVVIGMLMLAGCLMGPAFGLAGVLIPLFVFGRTIRGIIRSTTAGGIKSIREGGDGAVSANKRLRRVLDRAVEPVPCPQCGWYQLDMVREARSRSYTWLDWPILVLVILAPIGWYIAWQLQLTTRIALLDLDRRGPALPAIVVVGGCAALVGMILGTRWMLCLSVDPNDRRPGTPTPFPDSPLAITETEWARQMAAQTSRITAARSPRSPATVAGPRRIVPPRMP